MVAFRDGGNLKLDIELILRCSQILYLTGNRSEIETLKNHSLDNIGTGMTVIGT